MHMNEAAALTYNPNLMALQRNNYAIASNQFFYL